MGVRLARAELARIVSAQPHRFGVTGGPVRVRRLGAGESYEAWHVRAGGEDGGEDSGEDSGEDVVLRVVHRPVHELPRPMSAEFDVLPLVPAGIGPRAVLLDESPELLGSPFMVTSLVPGRVVDAWSPELLTAHARQLARLHAATRPGTVLLADHLRDSLAWWTAQHPDVVAQVEHLVPHVVAFVEPIPPAPRTTLIHGDAVPSNILVDDDGTPRYVDWEWGGFGDPAQDLAYLGGSIAAAPWYVPLTPAAIDHLLAAYRAVHPDDTLHLRRAGWEVCERFLTSLHFRLTGRRDAVEVLTEGLEREVMMAG